jgi:hypothetical protein
MVVVVGVDFVVVDIAVEAEKHDTYLTGLHLQPHVISDG